MLSKNLRGIYWRVKTIDDVGFLRKVRCRGDRVEYRCKVSFEFGRDTNMLCDKLQPPVLQPAPIPSVTIRALLLSSALYLGCPLNNWVVGLLLQFNCRNQFSWVFGPQENFVKLKEFSNSRDGRSEANFALHSELDSILLASAVLVYQSNKLGNCN
jgi:hypothetical protein